MFAFAVLLIVNVLLYFIIVLSGFKRLVSHRVILGGAPRYLLLISDLFLAATLLHICKEFFNGIAFAVITLLFTMLVLPLFFIIFQKTDKRGFMTIPKDMLIMNLTGICFFILFVLFI